MKKPRAYMIIDMQYGSTGKGLLAGYLAKKWSPDVVVTAWGPNAGHTFIDSDGRKFIHRMLANGVVSPGLKYVLIGPGSVIDPVCLAAELESCKDLLVGKTVIIHPNAVVVNASHIETEARNVKIGSTMKGTGAAVVQRIERDPDNMNVVAHDKQTWEMLDSVNVDVYISDHWYRKALAGAKLIQIEGAQGYSLSIYHGFYPYTTSRDVTPAQVMADCAIPFGVIPEVYGTLRTYPIRVSNRAKGEDSYSSGPCYDDQVELKWSDLGMEAELTTVTKLPRRIFTFSYEQLRDASFHCAPTKIFLNFVNYVNSDAGTRLMVSKIEKISGATVEWLGYGPTVDDVKSFFDEEEV